ncbi:relaxase/mobilization nuclease domain-containing protein [Vibrio diabolicus]|uniref:relaxase/mobilization nuclease domain-containing protein n=1 Tax=Vibrio diabolicus TaxID=50719 RepID=UPI00215FFCD2|nr:relaxase/mobilization nuclease domain-containing protein [Vibrio diabolicus]MCS0397882.1 relaxase/mobilization nuclease domain-containing protein [Vibrio diabolicus]
MISFASERGLGQDLATHLMNADHNEYVEVAFVRGAVADDLHGAFAEWEVQAHSLTKCKNYLYSVSVNPDPAQGPITRDQYLDFIGRVEQKLGLEEQPCAAVFHIKEGREHCHVVWSKIDTEKEKAVHLAFDHDKLMAVTRQFARDYNLSLPDGYHREGGAGKDQLTLYEKAQERQSGISHEERMEQVTDAWRQSDNARAFVHALAEQGYILAKGRRPYVLVDFYGGMNALPKMIDDKTVRTNDIRQLLQDDFPPESLPTVSEAKALVADYRKTMEAYFKDEERNEQVEALKQKQHERRMCMIKEKEQLQSRQRQDMETLVAKQKEERTALRGRHTETLGALKRQRGKFLQNGLSAFLGKVTGISLIRKKIHKHQDRKVIRAYLADKKDLVETHSSERDELIRLHEFQSIDINRRLKALDHVEKRELKTLEEARQREVRVFARGGRSQMPALKLALMPPGRKAVPHKAINRHKNKSLEERFIQARDHKTPDIELSEEFKRVADTEDSGKSDSNDSRSRKPKSPSGQQRYRRRRRDSEKDRDL